MGNRPRLAFVLNLVFNQFAKKDEKFIVNIDFFVLVREVVVDSYKIIRRYRKVSLSRRDRQTRSVLWLALNLGKLSSASSLKSALLSRPSPSVRRLSALSFSLLVSSEVNLVFCLQCQVHKVLLRVRSFVSDLNIFEWSSRRSVMATAFPSSRKRGGTASAPRIVSASPAKQAR